ncbi:hypothetical protein B0H17DRAFT_1123690 [Mycena rosella]|uniref:Uncharacterized protein n=1 Tax=Mycena rosella TaxID=1033263 RepID=A0AAD7MCD4_MYCRO|nr:hypothetical protein B0H17DRAFT_1123690 [Mycena rosella]
MPAKHIRWKSKTLNQGAAPKRARTTDAPESNDAPEPPHPTMFNLLCQLGVNPTAAEKEKSLHATANVAEPVAGAINGDIPVPVKVEPTLTNLCFILLSNSVAIQESGTKLKANFARTVGNRGIVLVM